MTSQDEETGASQANSEKATPRKKAGVGRQGAHVAAKQAKSGQNPTPKKKSAVQAKVAGTAREGSKAARVLDLLKRPDGATTKELLRATGWQAHSVRGFLSGTVGKKMGLTVMSTKTEDGERSYLVKA